MLFVCENNLYATESPLSVRMAPGTEICEKVQAFNISATKIDGNDVAAVYEATREAVAACRAGQGPVFIECMTYRWREHVGPLWDYEANRTYRTRDELDAWMGKCPVKRAGEALIAGKAATASDLEQWLKAIDEEIADTLKQAYESPWPDVSTLFENVY